MTPYYLKPMPYLISLLCLLLTGCITNDKDVILPQTGPTMKEVYDHHFEGRNNQSSPQEYRAPLVDPVTQKVRPIGEEATDLSGYTRESYNETQLVFQRLPNPDLVMYVFPHLSGPEQLPVPGYSTAFPFYETVQYALPGEVESD